MSSEKHFSLRRRLIEAMLADVLGTEISLESTQKAWEEVSQSGGGTTSFSNGRSSCRAKRS
jgi:hypothetical protein